jgi:hypothetical protein
MAISTFDGPVRSLNGFYSQGPGNVLTLGATVTLSVATHGGSKFCWFRQPARSFCQPLLLRLTLLLAPVADPNTTSTLGLSSICSSTLFRLVLLLKQ